MGARPVSQVGTKLRGRLKLAGVLTAAGLAIELLTLQWSHPTAFLAFILGGASLVAAGIALFLLTLVAD